MSEFNEIPRGVRGNSERNNPHDAATAMPHPASDHSRVAELEIENSRLHRLVAELLVKNQQLRKPD